MPHERAAISARFASLSRVRPAPALSTWSSGINVSCHRRCSAICSCGSAAAVAGAPAFIIGDISSVAAVKSAVARRLACAEYLHRFRHLIVRHFEPLSHCGVGGSRSGHHAPLAVSNVETLRSDVGEIGAVLRRCIRWRTTGAVTSRCGRTATKPDFTQRFINVERAGGKYRRGAPASCIPSSPSDGSATCPVGGNRGSNSGPSHRHTTFVFMLRVESEPIYVQHHNKTQSKKNKPRRRKAREKLVLDRALLTGGHHRSHLFACATFPALAALRASHAGRRFSRTAPAGERTDHR